MVAGYHHFRKPLYIFGIHVKTHPVQRRSFCTLGTVYPIPSLLEKNPANKNTTSVIVFFVFMSDTFQSNNKKVTILPNKKSQKHNQLTFLDPTSRCQPYQPSAEPSGFKTNKNHADFRVGNCQKPKV